MAAPGHRGPRSPYEVLHATCAPTPLPSRGSALAAGAEPYRRPPRRSFFAAESTHVRSDGEHRSAINRVSRPGCFINTSRRRHPPSPRPAAGCTCPIRSRRPCVCSCRELTHGAAGEASANLGAQQAVMYCSTAEGSARWCGRSWPHVRRQIEPIKNECFHRCLRPNSFRRGAVARRMRNCVRSPIALMAFSLLPAERSP